MIVNREPLTMIEVQESIKILPEGEKKTQIETFLKQFCKTTPEQAKKIKEECKKLDLIKIKSEHLIKLIDMLPEDSSDIYKIFSDVNLNEDEINKILDIVKNSK